MSRGFTQMHADQKNKNALSLTLTASIRVYPRPTLFFLICVHLCSSVAQKYVQKFTPGSAGAVPSGSTSVL
jgi:hypothetical protein